MIHVYSEQQTGKLSAELQTTSKTTIVTGSPFRSTNFFPGPLPYEQPWLQMNRGQISLDTSDKQFPTVCSCLRTWSKTRDKKAREDETGNNWERGFHFVQRTFPPIFLMGFFFKKIEEH